VTLLFAQTELGPLIATAGSWAMRVAALAVLVQPLFVAESANETLPDAPAVNVMFAVPWPPVMTPLVTVHAYVAPAIEDAEALAFAFGQTLDGAEIVTDGAAVTFTAVGVEVALQPPFVTVTV
jgi:hypothetical protein